jgi:hypothetical protein
LRKVFEDEDFGDGDEKATIYEDTETGVLS